MPAGERLSSDDPVIVDLDEPGSAADPSHDRASSDGPGLSLHRARTIGFVALGVGILALGLFIGHTNARTAAENEVRVFAGNVILDEPSESGLPWPASVTVINAGSAAIEVVGLELPGFDLDMADDAITVAADGRATAHVSLQPACDTSAFGDAAFGGNDPNDLSLRVAAGSSEHAVQSPISLRPAHLADVLLRQCQQLRQSPEPVLALNVVSADSARPVDTVSSRAVLRIGSPGDGAEVTDLRSLLPGFTIVGEGLPKPLGVRTPTTFVDFTWRVTDCGRAVTPQRDQGADIAVTIRTESASMETAAQVTGNMSADVALQLGLLAAARCPA